MIIKSDEIFNDYKPKFQALCINLSDLEKRERDELINTILDIAEEIIGNIKERR